MKKKLFSKCETRVPNQEVEPLRLRYQETKSRCIFEKRIVHNILKLAPEKY